MDEREAHALFSRLGGIEASIQGLAGRIGEMKESNSAAVESLKRTVETHIEDDEQKFTTLNRWMWSMIGAGTLLGLILSGAGLLTFGK